MSIGIHQKKIGEITIHDEQSSCSHEILNIFNRHGGPPLLIAQMQQGKTGVAIAVIHQFINYCIENNFKKEIIYLVNLSDNELKGQNLDRVRAAGLLNDVQIMHHAGLKTFTLNKNIDRRLIIVDECHQALGKSNSGSLKPFHEFMKKCGIKYGKSISNWENKENYVLSISATPFASCIQVELDKNSFEPVVLPVSEHYYSIQKLENDGRIFESQHVVEKISKNSKSKVVTEWFKLRIEEFKKLCESNGPGCMIVRTNGDGPNAIELFINREYPQIQKIIFGSNENNISDLDKTISSKQPKPLIVIIKGAMRAGKTIETTQHIRMWIESPKSNADTMCQTVGRCLGFEMIDGKNRREQDTFPIYCNIKELEIILNFYNGFNSIPSGVQNKKTVNVKKQYDFIILDSYPDRNFVIKEYLKRGGRIPDDIKKLNRNNPIKISSILSSDALMELLNCSVRHTEGHCVTYHIDGFNEIKSSHKYFSSLKKSYELMNPEWNNKYILCIPTGKNIEEFDDKIFEKCILSNIEYIPSGVQNKKYTKHSKI